jgi:predicted aldo/keto reductase-like oxidoreductase
MQNRRRFIRNSFITMTGAGLSEKLFSTSGEEDKSAKKERKYVYRTLGKTGIEIPVVSMGTGNCDNPNLVRAALDQGVKLFVTHEYYQKGNNEKMLGEVLKDRPRDSYMIMTGSNQGIAVDYKGGLFLPETDPEAFKEGVNGCLKRLHVDHLDVLSLGFGAKRESVFFEPLLKAMEELKKEGKAKYLSLATHSWEPEAVKAAADTGVYDLVMVAYNFRKDNREETAEALEYATRAGIGTIAMKTMAGVYWDKEKTRPINTRAALKWVLQNENIHTTVPDCSTFDELNQDLDIMGDMELTEDEKTDLKPPEEDATTGIFCQQCQECVSQCSRGLDIPTIMRSYMYAYGYRNLDLARNTINLVQVDSNPCGDCRVCQVKCRAGFDIRAKVMDIARIREIPEDLVRHV